MFFRRKKHREEKKKKLSGSVENVVVGLIIGGAIASIVGKTMLGEEKEGKEKKEE